MEIEEPIGRKANPISKEANGSTLREEMDIFEENRILVALTNAIIQQASAAKYNHHVWHREFSQEISFCKELISGARMLVMAS